MFAVLVLGAIFVTAMIVIGVLAAVAGLVGFVISLPFRILGLAFRFVGLLIALPFLLIGGLFTFGLALLPLAPVIGLVWLAWWWFRRPERPRSHASVAS